MEHKTFDPMEHLLFECITGSRLYGTATKDSDTDYRGVCLPPMSVLLDPFMKFNVKDSFENEDKAIYDLGKFMNLCADMNPNIVELLFVPKEFTLYTTSEWKTITDNRHLFLSKNAKHRFLGYAFSQLEAIKRHREWFINPPDHEPTRAEFGLGEMPSYSMEWLNSMKHTMNFDLLKDEFVDEVRREWSFRDSHKHWENYQMWQKNRNPARKGTEEKFGYDTKYASHLFRLISEGRELLQTGFITLPLPNAAWLLDIKSGVYSYEEILKMAADFEKEFDSLYKSSPLPHSPDRNALKELYLQIVERREL